jgi:hypothetical protein
MSGVYVITESRAFVNSLNRYRYTFSPKAQAVIIPLNNSTAFDTNDWLRQKFRSIADALKNGDREDIFASCTSRGDKLCHLLEILTGRETELNLNVVEKLKSVTAPIRFFAYTRTTENPANMFANSPFRQRSGCIVYRR